MEKLFRAIQLLVCGDLPAKPNEEKREVEVEIANAYLGRIRSFQSSLIGWGITWNIALIGASFLRNDEAFLSDWIPFVSLIFTFILNIMLRNIYRHERLQKQEQLKILYPNRKTGNAPFVGETYRALSVVWWILQCSIFALLIAHLVSRFTCPCF